MQKWEYAHAIYKDGLLDPHIKEGLSEIGQKALGLFLPEAGQKGWELCGVLPYPTADSPDGTLAVIFKRPLEPPKKEKPLTQPQGRKFR